MNIASSTLTDPATVSDAGVRSVSTLTLLISALLLAAPIQAQSPLFDFRRIGPGLYASLTREDIAPSSYANAIVVEGEDGVLLVDTQHSPSAGRDLVEAIRERTDVPVRWIVNTHFHGDHVWGNAALLEAWPEAVLLGHPHTRDRLVEEGAEQVAQERVRLGDRITRIEGALVSGQIGEADQERAEEALARARGQLRELETLRVTPPVELVVERITLDLGGREVEVFHPGPAHTDGDLVVWVPDARFLAAGDLLEDGALWLEGADVRGWAEALRELQELNPDRVLPSHGRLRTDAVLLATHADFLGDALSLNRQGVPVESVAWVDALDEHRSALEVYGVEGAAFEAYVAAVRRGLEGGEEER